MSRDFLDKMNDNLRTVGVKMAEHIPRGETRQFGSITAGVAGVPVPQFNRLLLCEVPSRDELSAAVEWMTERDLPFWVTAPEPVAEEGAELLADLDFVVTEEQPGMVLPSLEEIPPRESEADLCPVNDTAGLDAFTTVFSEVFDLPRNIVQQITPSSFLTDDRIDVFVGRIADQPVACGQLVQSGDVAGVYTIGVVEEFRRHGIGEAMTWEVLRTGREAGCQIGALRSSEMALPLYERMGFETVAHYQHFERSS